MGWSECRKKVLGIKTRVELSCPSRRFKGKQLEDGRDFLTSYCTAVWKFPKIDFSVLHESRSSQKAIARCGFFMLRNVRLPFRAHLGRAERTIFVKPPCRNGSDSQGGGVSVRCQQIRARFIVRRGPFQVFRFLRVAF